MPFGQHVVVVLAELAVSRWQGTATELRAALAERGVTVKTNATYLSRALASEFEAAGVTVVRTREADTGKQLVTAEGARVNHTETTAWMAQQAATNTPATVVRRRTAEQFCAATAYQFCGCSGRAADPVCGTG
jgi:hypothetical protein